MSDERDRSSGTRREGRAKATGRPTGSRRRRRARRARRVRRIAAAVVIAALVLGLAGLGLWRLFDARPEITVQAYPMEYEAAIRACAADSGLDPALPAAVILAESSYRPQAVSQADARGLMQLLPSTAEWISEKLGEAFDEAALFDPDVNIRYGCWYLGFLMRRFGGDMTCAVAAYHAGQGRVDEWLANPEYSPDGAALSLIPSQATDVYVKRVLKYYEKYERLYAPAD